MPVTGKLFHLLPIFQLLIVTSLCAQQPGYFLKTKKNSSYPAQNQRLDDPIPHESDCSNGIDDNGNGLVDSNDSHCYFYFDSLNHHKCEPTTILWASSDLGIHWINLTANEERLVFPPIKDELLVDIAWIPNGKLYAATQSGKVYEIDPQTWESTPIDFVQGYQPNGMTSDGTGMLYFTAYADLETCDLLKFDPVTHKSEKIVRLSDYGLLASGDCCFLNGFIYVSCNGYIAKVDINAKTVEKLKVNDLLYDDSWGITTLGDGYLYVSDNTTGIYRLDPVTMEGTLIRRFLQPQMVTTGYASYVDACNAPCSKPKVTLGTDTVVCKISSLVLEANADINVSSFLWSDGTTQKSNTITSPGTYWVKADNGCDTNYDTVVVSSADIPMVKLGGDTLICEYNSIMLNNLHATHQYDHFLWSDNSDQSTFTVREPGTYWLQVSNVCGSVSDTVQISPKVDNCECFVNIPNAFSPNADHVNDVFMLSSDCALQGSVEIFNRWGQAVYKSENLNEGWNGMMGDKMQPEGLYVYTLRFSYRDRPGVFNRKGTITLVR